MSDELASVSDDDLEITDAPAAIESFVRTSVVLQGTAKQQQKQPLKYQPSEWLELTARSCEECLAAGESLLSGLESDEIKASSLAMSEGAVTSALESVIEIAVDDPGLSISHALERLGRAEALARRLGRVKGFSSNAIARVRKLASDAKAALTFAEADPASAEASLSLPAPVVARLAAVEGLCLWKVAQLAAPPQRLEAIESLRSEVYSRLSSNYRFDKEFRSGGGVFVFGSSLAALASPNSDVDLCISLPLHGREMAILKHNLEAAKAKRLELESVHPALAAAAAKAAVNEQRLKRILHEFMPSAKAKLREKEHALKLCEQALKPALSKVHRGEAAEAEAAEAAAAEAEAAAKGLALNLRKAREAHDAAVKKCAEVAADEKRTLAALATAKVPDSASAEWNRLVAIETKAQKEITDASRIVYAVANTLERPNGGAFAPWARKHFQVVGRARVPVVKVQQGAFHYRHGGPSGGSHSLSPSAASSTATTLAFDCVVNNELALRNSRLLAAYASVDPRARALVFLVKHWAKAKGLSDAPNGYPSSYCHTVLALFFLQQPPDALAEAMAAPPLAPVSRSPRAPRAPQALAVLPNLQLIGRSAAGAAGGLKVEGLDTYFCEDLGLARACVQGGLKGGVQGVPDQRSVAELVASYFRFLHWLLTRGLSRCVSLRLSRMLPEKRLLWANSKSWRLSVEDPFEAFDSKRPHDLGQVLTQNGMARLVAEAKRAAALADEPIEAWADFLGIAKFDIPAVAGLPAGQGHAPGLAQGLAQGHAQPARGRGRGVLGAFPAASPLKASQGPLPAPSPVSSSSSSSFSYASLANTDGRNYGMEADSKPQSRVHENLSMPPTPPTPRSFPSAAFVEPPRCASAAAMQLVAAELSAPLAAPSPKRARDFERLLARLGPSPAEPSAPLSALALAAAAAEAAVAREGLKSAGERRDAGRKSKGKVKGVGKGEDEGKRAGKGKEVVAEEDPERCSGGGGGGLSEQEVVSYDTIVAALAESLEEAVREVADAGECVVSLKALQAGFKRRRGTELTSSLLKASSDKKGRTCKVTFLLLKLPGVIKVEQEFLVVTAGADFGALQDVGVKERSPGSARFGEGIASYGGKAANGRRDGGTGGGSLAGEGAASEESGQSGRKGKGKGKGFGRKGVQDKGQKAGRGKGSGKGSAGLIEM